MPSPEDVVEYGLSILFGRDDITWFAPFQASARALVGSELGALSNIDTAFTMREVDLAEVSTVAYALPHVVIHVPRQWPCVRHGEHYRV